MSNIRDRTVKIVNTNLIYGEQMAAGKISAAIINWHTKKSFKIT
jgi:hypothetical protein